jgi:hypothetical protein
MSQQPNHDPAANQESTREVATQTVDDLELALVAFRTVGTMRVR